MSSLSAGSRRTFGFWALFLAEVAPACGFGFFVTKIGVLGGELGLTEVQIGQVFGATLWPIAVMMIAVALFVDFTGYKIPLIVGCAMIAVGSLAMALANSYGLLVVAAHVKGLGHGIVSGAAIPACAALYPRAKTRMLLVLSASWPVGLAATTTFILTGDALVGAAMPWRIHALAGIAPALAACALAAVARFPADDRVRAGVPYLDMLAEVGFLCAFLMLFFLFDDNAIRMLMFLDLGTGDPLRFWICMIAGAMAAMVFGILVRSPGRVLLFAVMLLMIPLAFMELGIDQWIQRLIAPAFINLNLNPSLAIPLTAGIIILARLLTGLCFRRPSPLLLAFVGGFISMAGLLVVSNSSGVVLYFGFALFTVGLACPWPCAQGFVAERFPRGGALALNAVSALGLLSVGTIGFPFMSAVYEIKKSDRFREAMGGENSTTTASLWGIPYEMAVPSDFFDPGDPVPEQEREALSTIEAELPREMLRFLVWCPAIVALGFLGLWLRFRLRGGYAPVVLEDPPGPDPPPSS